MRRVLEFAGITVTFFLTAFYILSCFTPYISPLRFSVFTLFGLLYLPLVFSFLLLIIIWAFIRRRTALLLLFIFLLGYKNLFSTFGFNVFSTWKEQKAKGSLRVMSWNVNGMYSPFVSNDSANSPRHGIINYIHQVQPDILCLQDFGESGYINPSLSNAFISNTRDILKAGGFQYYLYRPFYLYYGPNYYDQIGVAIFSKLPITDSGFIILNNATQEKAAFVTLQLQDKPIRIVTAHFASMSLWPNNSRDSAGIKYLEGDSTKQRMKNIFFKVNSFSLLHQHQVMELKKYMDSSAYPLFFTADLNEVPSSYVYHTLKKGLKDAFLENDFGIGGTYNRIFPKLRIDVMLHSNEIEVVQFKRPAVDLSDHYPIVADIRWKE